MPVISPYTYCVSKLFRKEAGIRIIINFLHSASPTLIARNGLERTVVRSRARTCFHYLLYSSQSIETLNVVENENIFQVPEVPQDIVTKVKYNCILSEKTMKMGWFQRKRFLALEARKERERRKNAPDIPFSLKYLDENIDVKTKPNQKNSEGDSVVLPFHQETSAAFKSNDSDEFYSDRPIDIQLEFSKGITKTKDWLNDYEFYRNTNQSVNMAPWQLNYGTPDRSIPISSVPCGGCGAYLQCQDTGIPGYLPSEFIKHCTKAELRAIKCQRCHFLQQYNMALNLNVSPDDYPRLLSHLKNERALAVLLVDLVDFPCSLWPGILEIVGTKRPVIVVGNKVDLLPSDSSQFLSYAKEWLWKAVQKTELASANVKDVMLVSAQTGFGVEELITKMHMIWGYEGDVYLLGCTNVGKSTLFNALLQSDYCKVQAVDIMQRATTSPWPGTTLNLLKFPILRADGWRLYQRVDRLQALQRKQQAERELLRQQLKKKHNPRAATLIGHIGCTFEDMTNISSGKDPFSLRITESGHVKLPGLDPNHKDFVKGKWCYDTPGTIHPDQIIDILTAQELIHLQASEMILPRTFSLLSGDSILIAGLGRLDFEGGAEKAKFTVFAASTLPVTVCRTADVDLVYESLAASNLLVVPSFKPERLSQWPGLTSYPQPFEVTGIGRESAADVVLSSAGWIAVTPEEGFTCVLRAWTPFARGIHFRQPALLRFSVCLRGRKVGKTPAFLMGEAVRV
ncbi:hypothetical protein R5R35_011850 [Gryllus longicercus]|uniref:G domain-containing protein n=1 Tax=Gryllus longicercus TaxID=2509291 RepID=A0AAN9VNZ1_9ORTH